MFTSEILKVIGASETTVSGRNRQISTAQQAAATCPLKDRQRLTIVVTEWLHSPHTPAIGKDIRNLQRGRNWNATTALASRARNVRKISNARAVDEGADK